MKKVQIKTLVLMATIGMYACSEPQQAVDQVQQMVDTKDVIPGKYIVAFRNEFSPSGRSLETTFSSREEKAAFSARIRETSTNAMRGFLEDANISEGKITEFYTAVFTGFAAELSDDEVNKLLASDQVESVEPDRWAYLEQSSVERVDAEMAQTTTCATTNAGGAATGSTAKWIWVVDSGIDLDHPDLNVVTNTTYSKSFVGGTADDCNGHGTHVAGIAAARNNTIGMVGVSAGAPVVSVRVFGCTGGSAASTIISGINHVASYDEAGDVMNLSLGGYFGANCATSSSYRTAVTAVANGGTHVAIAAGNSSDNAALYQPACINGTRIYTVSSMNCNKTFANSYSNYGQPPVDWIATGSSVYSTYLNGGYATLSGTSMATPVVAGILHQRNAAPTQCGSVSYGGQTYKIACR